MAGKAEQEVGGVVSMDARDARKWRDVDVPRSMLPAVERANGDTARKGRSSARTKVGTTVGASLGFRIQEVLPRTKGEYYRLVLVVGPARSGKTTALTDLSKRHGWPRLNVNLLLSEKLLDLTQRQRAIGVSRILDDIVRAQQSDVVLLDNIELLFAKELEQDPLRLLQSLSRNRTIVAAWPGHLDGDALSYAEPSHPEIKRYQAPQAVIVGSDESKMSDAAEESK
jgi:hypothetical protein